MRILRRIGMAALVVGMVLSGACSAFEDPTPNNITFRMSGTSGTIVEAIYSTQFIAGVDDANTTHVQIYQADTVQQTLPIDTVIDIAVDRRFFVQIAPVSVAQTSVQVRVDVDDRNVLNDSGDVFASDPWRYVYLFNQQVSRIIDVVF